MPHPYAPTIALDRAARERLVALTRAHSTPQALVFRCRLVLRMADDDARSNLQIANEFGCARNTVAHWRIRFARLGLEGLQDLPRRVGRGAFPPEEQLQVITLATSATAEHDCVASQWSLDDLASVLVNRHADEARQADNVRQAMSRSTIWRVLQEADLKPHRSVYWLNSHDPDFDAKAEEICRLYVRSPALHQQGELVICADEKTGMQILERKHPTQLIQPGKPEKREHEYIRHGTRALIASFVVPTGEVVWDLGVTRTSRDFAAHLGHVAAHLAARCPDHRRFHWVLDNLNTHWSLDVCELMAQLNGVPFRKRSLIAGVERRAFLTDREHRPSFISRPSTVLGSIRSNCGSAPWLDVFSNEATSLPQRSSSADCMPTWTITTHIERIPTAGPTRDSRWCEPRRSAEHGVNSARAELGSARVRSSSSEPSTRRAPIGAERLRTAQRLPIWSSSTIG
jgi:hypothetical protein